MITDADVMRRIDALEARPVRVRWVVRSDVNAAPAWLRYIPNGAGLDYFGHYNTTEDRQRAACFPDRTAAQSWADRWSDFPGVWRPVARVGAPSRRVPA